MAFNIPGSESGGGDNGEFLGRLQYDSRVGFWKVVKRVQGPDGRWGSEPGEMFPPPLTFLLDAGSLEVGYIKLDSAPAFLLVPYGSPIPQQPQEMKTDEHGKQRKAFLPGFRVKVMSPKTFGDNAAYYFAANAKTVLGPMDDLFQQFLAAPEAATGLIPAIAVTGKRTIEAGQSKFYAPVWNIAGWHPRPEVFGQRTVPAPGAKVAPAAAPVHTAPPANHVPPPVAPVAPPAVVAAAGMPDFGGGSALNDAVPFAAEWR